MTVDLSQDSDLFGGTTTSSGGFGFGDALKLGSAAAALGGGITGAIGASQAAAGQAQSFQAQALAYQNDAAEQGRQAAQNWFSLGRQNLRALYKQNQLVGAQRALYGAAGVAPGSGTPLDVMADTEDQFGVDNFNRYMSALFTGQRAGRQSAFDVQASDAEQQAAKNAKDAGSTSAFGSILSGLGPAVSIASKIFGFL